MGILLSQMRLTQITSYRADLEEKLQLIATTKVDLSNQISDMVGLGANLDSKSPEMKLLEERKARLVQAEKALDQQYQRYQTQLQMINQEEQSVKQELQQSIQRSFGS